MIYLITGTPGFNTQPPEGGWLAPCVAGGALSVTTHSRLKAAVSGQKISHTSKSCFNTQPPEGGWTLTDLYKIESVSFNTQPPEGGWDLLGGGIALGRVSTHSRLKAAVQFVRVSSRCLLVSTHSRLKAAARAINISTNAAIVSTHSRLKAAGKLIKQGISIMGFNTQPPEGGCFNSSR